MALPIDLQSHDTRPTPLRGRAAEVIPIQRARVIDDFEGPAYAASAELVYARDDLDALLTNDAQGDAIRDQLRAYLRKIGEHRALGLLAAYQVHEDAEDALVASIATRRTVAHGYTRRIAENVERLLCGRDGDGGAA